MPETDTINATPTDPLNPDYGWQKKRPVTHLVAKANAGPSYIREITDVGHQFMLNWGSTINSQKSFADIQRLKRYYEQYRDGFFTLVDHEGNGREYVGRFVTPVEPIPVGHNRWAAQNVLFEEVPGAPMVTYPSDWTNESISRYALNDFGEVQPAVDDAASWAIADFGWAPYHSLYSNVADAWAQLSYVGWGCQIWGILGAGGGIAEVFLDGVSQGTIDFYDGGIYTGYAVLMMTIEAVPLGIHTLRLVVTGTKDEDSSDFLVWFYQLQVMR